VVIPYNYNDINAEWYSKLRKLPFDLRRKRMEFYVISDGADKNF